MLGFLVFDKPVGLTSHDIVGMTRAVTGIKKIGHTGTLDPFATGVLPLAIGPATRLIQYLDEGVKVYDATICLGTSTTTGDVEGDIAAQAAVPDHSDAQLRAVLDGFLGPQLQTPPRYSAVKVNGKPLYAYARKGQDVTAKPRPIRVDTIDVLDRSSAHLRLRIQCGRGTYIRVIAEDIGKAMGTVAHLTALRREQSGPFVLSGALTASALATIVAGTDDWQSALRRRRGEDRMPWAEREVVRAALTAQLQAPLQALHHLPEVQIDPGMVTLVRNGGRPPPPPPGAERYALAHGAELIALAHRTERGPRLLKVIPAASS